MCLWPSPISAAMADATCYVQLASQEKYFHPQMFSLCDPACILNSGERT